METQLLLFFFFCCFFAGRWRKESVHDCYKKRHNFQLSETHPDNVALPSFRLMLSVFRFFQDCWTRVNVSKAWFFCRGVLEFLSKAKGEWQLLVRANSFSSFSFYYCEFTHSFSSSSVTTILDNESRQKEGRKERSCLSAGGDDSLQRLTNLEEEPGVAAAVAGGEGFELATHRHPPPNS
jgi:hypothetical protein